MRDPREAFEAIGENADAGRRRRSGFRNGGDRLLSHSTFLPIWERFASTGLPLCVHMGMSYTPFEQVCQNLLKPTASV